MSALDGAGVTQLRATYAGMVLQCDEAVGALLAALRRTGDWDRTPIAVTSDHGDPLGDHHLWGASGYFDAAHVPLISRASGREADAARGMTVDAFTGGVDLMPTILDRAGCPIPVACDGEALVPFLRGAERPSGWRREARWELDSQPVPGQPAPLGLHSERRGLTVLGGERFKYVHFAALAPLLFDLGGDADELCAVAGRPDYRDVELACAQRQLSWRMSHDDRTLSHLRLVH